MTGLAGVGGVRVLDADGGKDCRFFLLDDVVFRGGLWCCRFTMAVLVLGVHERRMANRFTIPKQVR